MNSRVVSTDAGTFILSSPTAEILGTLAKWPDVIQVQNSDERPLIQINFKNEDEEPQGLAMNFIGYSNSELALGVFEALRVYLPFSIRELANDFAGVLLACAYAQDFEAGYVLFGRTLEDPPFLSKFRPLKGFDTLFGPGGNTMVGTFLKGAVQACRAFKLEPRVDFGFARRSDIETIAFDFMLVGKSLIYLKPEVIEDEDIWQVLVKAGFDEVFHLPVTSDSIPAESTGNSSRSESK